MKSRGNCLVIEHDHDVRELLAVILAGEGFDVYTFATAAEGALAARNLDLALIALDLGPPGGRRLRTRSHLQEHLGRPAPHDHHKSPGHQ